MALTLRGDGTGTAFLVSSSWWNDFYNLLTGNMNDQIVFLKYTGGSSTATLRVQGTSSSAPLQLLNNSASQVFKVDNSGNVSVQGNMLSTAGTLVIQSKQSGSAVGIEFDAWNGTAKTVPFSIGGQFNSALAYVDNSGNITGVGITAATLVATKSSAPSGNTGIVTVQVSGDSSGRAVLGLGGTSLGNSGMLTLSKGSGTLIHLYTDGSGNLLADGGIQPNGAITSLAGSLTIQSKQSGSASGIEFDSWSGSAKVVVFSLGSQLNSALSYVDGSGGMHAASYQTTGGNSLPKLASAGGGSNGANIWEGTTDPAGSAAEGDIWIKA